MGYIIERSYNIWEDSSGERMTLHPDSDFPEDFWIINRKNADEKEECENGLSISRGEMEKLVIIFNEILNDGKEEYENDLPIKIPNYKGDFKFE